MAIPGSSSTPAIDNIEPAAEKKLKDHAGCCCMCSMCTASCSILRLQMSTVIELKCSKDLKFITDMVESKEPQIKLS